MISLIDYYRELQGEALKDIKKCTCQFLTEEKNGKAKAHASGIFINVDDSYFLITAAHVVEKHKDEIFVPLRNFDALQLGGTLTTNVAFQKEKDKIDIAIIKLSEDAFNLVNGYYSFLSQNELGISHEVKKLPSYLSFGYVCSGSKVKYGTDKFIAKPFNYVTVPADEKIYKELSCQLFENIIIHYDKKKVFNYRTKETKVGPDPFGISGSGLWYIPPNQIVKPGDKVSKQLVGIMIEWPIQNRKYWISTRIDILTEIIRQKYSLNIPQSTIVKVNFTE